MTNQARDLFLLSAVAFQNGRPDQAGKLYVAALSSEDAPAFLQDVQGLDRPMQRTEVTAKPKKKQVMEHTLASIVRSMEATSGTGLVPLDPVAAPGVQIGMAEGEGDVDLEDEDYAEDEEDHYGASNRTLDSGTDTGEIDVDNPSAPDIVQSLSSGTPTGSVKFKVTHLELPPTKINV